MEDVWKEAFPVGTEWDQYEGVYAIPWDFTNLEEAFEEGGILHGKTVYMFGCTEPQLVHFTKDGATSSRILHIPAVVAVTSPVPPSDKLGIKSVQMEHEMIVPMKEMKMDWVPYIPQDVADAVERVKARVFTLKCTQRRAALRRLTEERLKKYEYCLPYFYNPLNEDEVQANTELSIFYSFDYEAEKIPEDKEGVSEGSKDTGKAKKRGRSKGKKREAEEAAAADAAAKENEQQQDKAEASVIPPLVTDFDWQFDEVEEFTDKLIEEEQLPADHRDKFMAYLKKEIEASKAVVREAKKARAHALKELTSESRAALENVRKYKFYPVPAEGTPDIAELKASYINRYYGKADQVL
eukprot:jgi/Mesen1/10210/ME000077S09540